MIDIKTIGKRKQGNTSTKIYGGGYANNASNTIAKEIQGVRIWGQYHDHTDDVDGDLTANGDIVSAGTITAANGQINGNMTVNGNVNAANGAFSGNISGRNITSANITNSGNITTKNLTVSGSANFFNLTIDEIKSVGGQIILSAANATIEHVDTIGDDYELAWRKSDDSKGIENMFKVGDQVICQTFNKTDATGQNVTNKYYWALITSMGETYLYLDGEERECYYINISGTYFDGQGIPAAGDKICQLGYRGTDDPQRQSAIILSAYQSPDPNVNAPSIVQYKGINSFSLDGCIVNQMSPDNNIFTGDFKVENNGTITDVVDLIQGQHPQVITDSEQAWMMGDSTGKTYALTDYQNLPTTIKAYLGSEVIPYSEWITGSQIKFKNTTYRLTGANPAYPSQTGLGITAITRNTNDCAITWGYSGSSGTTETNKTLEITIKFTHNGTTYTVTKNVPFNMIKASEVTQGADAEFDKLMVDKFDLTVTMDNKLTSNVNAKVYHVKGSTIEQITDLSDYTANIMLSNNQAVTLNKSTYFYRNSNITSSYSSMTTPPTSATLRLYKDGTLVDEVTTAIKFNAGSIFTMTDNAITSAVQQSQTYTDGQITTVNANISQVQQTANSISSRVTNIENDYVTSSELTQTANNIQLNVYDELMNKTGIDVSQGQITLNGNTIVNGNLTLTEGDTGFTLIGDGGTTQIMPKSIGTYEDFAAMTTTTVRKKENGAGLEEGVSGQDTQFTFVVDYNLGKVKAGSLITMTPISRNYYVYMEHGLVNITSYEHVVSSYFEFIEDGVVISNSAPYTTHGGNLTVRFHITAGFYTTAFSYSHEPWMECTIDFTLPIDSFTLIGYDGIGLNFGSNKNVYIGSESSTFRYGRYGFKISARGIDIYNGTYWYDLDSYIAMIAGSRNTTT